MSDSPTVEAQPPSVQLRGKLAGTSASWTPPEREGIELQFYESLLRKERIGPAAAKLGISYKTGYRLARKLEASGVLRRDGLKWPNQYVRGPNAADWDVRLARWRAGKAVRQQGAEADYPMECRVHGASLRCEITDTYGAPPPAARTDIPAKKRWCAGPSKEVPHVQLDIEISGVTVGVQFVGARDPVAIIYPPPMIARNPRELFDIVRRVIPDLAREAIRVLSKQFNVAFSERVVWNQPPEFAFPDTNGLLALSREAYFRIYSNEGAWVDGSEGWPEYETRSFDLALLAFSIPSLLRSGHLRWVDHPEDSHSDNPDSNKGKSPNEPAPPTLTSDS